MLCEIECVPTKTIGNDGDDVVYGMFYNTSAIAEYFLTSELTWIPKEARKIITIIIILLDACIYQISYILGHF